MTELLTSISRSDTIPIVKQIEVTKNKGYLTLDVSSFTPRMFYELPAIRFEVYTETNGTRVKYNTVDNVIRTYQHELFPDHEKIVVCIKNIPNTCYLYITPIFDNDSVPARNMLIENGVETGDLWDIVPTSTFPITIGFDGQTEPGYPTTTITGVPPISFRSDGTALTAWSISGNMVQTGTPTPSAPITPQECGNLVESGEHAGQYAIPLTLAGQTQTIYLSEPLRKIGYYCDTVEQDGTVTRKIKKLVLTGLETWQLWSGNYFSNVIDRRGAINAILCSHFINSKPNGISYDNYSSSGLEINASAVPFVANVTELKQWLADEYAAGHPVTVWYVLKTPTTETVTVPTLTPTKGSNTLAVSTTLQPSEISITGGVRQQ